MKPAMGNNRLTPGIGESGPMQKRAASSERFIGQFTKTLITAKDATGKERQFEVLAITGAPSKSAPRVFGSFWGTYIEKGDTYLQGGTVSAGSKTETIENIKVLDRNTRTGSLEGKILWMEATVNGVASEGVILPGANLTEAKCSTESTIGTKVPSNTLPTAKSANGKKVFVEIGRWTKNTFLPSRQGNIQINFCPGSFTIYR